MHARSAVLAVLALLTVGFAGCLEAGDPVDPQAADAALSEPRFGVLPGESVWIEASSDGTGLHMRLFLPDTAEDPEWRAPTILVMSPYFRPESREDRWDASSRPAYFRYQWLIDHFVPRGYAVAFADVRGTGESGGCLEQTAELQRQDGYDTVEWLAAQDWSNGRVGMFGKSYDAETQQGTAVLAPPALKTIVPVASVSGQYEWNYYDGVPFTLHTLIGNAAYAAGSGLPPGTTARGLTEYPTRPGCHPFMLAEGADTSGDWNDYWEVREFRKLVDGIEASVLYVHGLQDWNVKPVAVRDWFDRIPSEKRAILGQWAHDYPNENRHREEWSRADWRETVHAWYDHWLLERENGIMERLPPVQVQDSEGAWRAEETFPPVDATPLTFHLAPGALTLDAPAAFEPMRVRENVEDWTGAPTLPSGAFADHLVFESEPLASDVRFSGWPTMTFTATMTDATGVAPTADAHFAVTLYDVHPDGTEEWVNRAYLSARHRDGVEDPQPVPTGEELTFHLRFFPGDTVIPAGHGLKLVLQGSDDWAQPQGSLWGAEVHGGTFTLPVVERDLDAVGLDVPFGDPVTS